MCVCVLARNCIVLYRVFSQRRRGRGGYHWRVTDYRGREGNMIVCKPAREVLSPSGRL